MSAGRRVWSWPAPRSARASSLRWLSLVLVAGLLASCDGANGCGGSGEIGTTFPSKARNEGGIQVRITDDGFGFAADNLQPIIMNALGDQLDICIPGGGDGIILGGYQYCSGVCSNGQQGCQISLEVGGIDFPLQEPDQMAVTVHFDDLDVLLDAEAYVGNPPVSFDVINCSAHVHAESFPISVPVTFTIEEGTGYLQPQVGMPDIGLDSLEFDLNGDLICEGVNALLSSGLVRDIVLAIATPAVEAAVSVVANRFLCLPCDADGGCPAGGSCFTGVCMRGLQCLARPLGIESELDPASLLGEYLRPDPSKLAFLVVAGGFAQVEAEGLSVGVTAGFDTEQLPAMTPAPPPPANPVPRAAALANNVSPDGEPFHVALGIHEWVIQRALWAAYESGTLLVQVDSSLSAFLSTSNLAMIMPSLRTLTEDEDRPIMLSLSPIAPPRLTIGAGTLRPDPDNPGQFLLDEPLITLGLDQVSLDLHTYVQGRLVRFVRITLDIGLPIGLEFTPDNELIAVLDMETFADAFGGSLTVTESELLQEDPAMLAAMLPSLLTLVLPLLTEALLNPIALPTFEGFELDMRHGTATGIEDNTMLGIFAGLAYTPPGEEPPPEEPPAEAQAQAEGFLPPGPGARYPRLLAQIVSPEIPDGQAEVQWRVDRGFWSPFAAAGHVRISGPTLAIPGRHLVEVRARRRGEYRSLGPITTLEVDVPRPTLPPQRRLAAAGALVPGAVVERREAPASSASPRLTIVRTAEGSDAPPVALAEGEGCAVGAAPASAVAPWIGLLLVGLALTLGRARRLSRRAVMGASLGIALGALLVGSGCHEENPAGGGGPGGGADAGAEGEGEGEGEGGGEGEGEGEACPDGCPDGQECVEGECRAVEPCGECAEGEVCCPGEGRCVDPDAPECADEQCEPGYQAVVVEPGTFDAESCSWAGQQCGCEELPPLQRGDVGAYASLGAAAGVLAMAAYDSTYGDLVVGVTHPADPMEGFHWDLVDGLPADAPIEGAPSGYRGGVKQPGPNVGQHASLAVGEDGVLHVAYYDATERDLRYARGVEDGDEGYVWALQTVDAEADAGSFASLSLSAAGAVAIAYRVRGLDGAGGGRAAALRVATGDGEGGAWEVVELDRAPVEAQVAGPQGLGVGLGVGIDLARHRDGTLVVVYYDSQRGSLRLVRQAADGSYEAPVLLDGEGVGPVFGDRGRFPSLAVDAARREHVVYMDSDRGQLWYTQPGTGVFQMVDDGLRSEVDGTVGIHRVGADTRILIDREGLVRVFYQDSTALDLVEAAPLPAGDWRHMVLAGGGDAYLGAFGFYNDAAVTEQGHGVVCYRIDRQSVPPNNGLHLLLR